MLILNIQAGEFLSNMHSTVSGERGSCFGFIPDAFSGRSPSLPSESGSGGSRSASVAGASSMSGESSRSASPGSGPSTTLTE